jgi:UDP-N-acetylglucosamine 1-carboxyvinyltransferase
MARYIIEGGNSLNGRIRISGNKNAILPCIAASLLTSEEVILRNVPRIADVEIMLEILKGLGANVEFTTELLKIRVENINSTELPKDLTTKLRASVLLVGPLLARSGEVKFYHPGGDVIGKRSIDTHLEGFKQLGFDLTREDREYQAKTNSSNEKSSEIYLEDPSVTGTENLILTSVLGYSEITLKNCAKEPHVVDLCNMLNSMGAQIEGVGNSTLKIKGVESLHGADFTIGPDYLELGAYAIASVITHGNIEMENCSLNDLEPVVAGFKKMGVKLYEENNAVKVSCEKLNSVPEFPGLYVNIWPGFPTDLMSVFIVLATQAEGVTLLHDWMYESRMFFVDKLISMRANIIIADPHRVLVYGPTELKARDLETPDIRAGMALLLAALIAKGTSTIHKAQLIERGYENVVEKLQSLGAKITREE